MVQNRERNKTRLKHRIGAEMRPVEGSRNPTVNKATVQSTNDAIRHITTKFNTADAALDDHEYRIEDIEFDLKRLATAVRRARIPIQPDDPGRARVVPDLLASSPDDSVSYTPVNSVYYHSGSMSTPDHEANFEKFKRQAAATARPVTSQPSKDRFKSLVGGGKRKKSKRRKYTKKSKRRKSKRRKSSKRS